MQGFKYFTMEQRYKEFKDKFELTDDDVSKWFGYKSANSFRNSTRYTKVINGILEVYSLFLNDT